MEQEIKDQLDADGGATDNIKVCEIPTFSEGFKKTEQCQELIIYSSTKNLLYFIDIDTVAFSVVFSYT
ncbi:unnamed protein product [Brugia timori]|uniref:Uncharacterized protein n=1 Tax=Brugia timori TaxID=42155 RepID=A0A3P7T9L5_9BILA|nr:unnamed protein product [Brugia timori]